MPWKGKPGHGSTYTQIILASLRYCEVMHIAFKYQSKRYHTKYFEIASSSSFMRCTHICVCVRALLVPSLLSRTIHNGNNLWTYCARALLSPYFPFEPLPLCAIAQEFQIHITLM